MRRRTSLSTLLASFLVALALLASACGDDGDDPAASDDTGDGGTDADADADQADDATDADADDPASTTDDAAATDEELTASAPGITETTVRVGVAIADTSTFTNVGDIAARYRAVADRINAAGGVIGRQLELVVTEWDILDTAGFDAACVELTEDVEVFAVITRTPASFGSMTCYTELGDTIVINGLDLDAVEAERADGLLYSTLSDRFAALLGGVGLLADELDGATVAVTAASEAGGEDKADALAAELESLGVEVGAITVSAASYADDPTAALAEQDRFAEIWNTGGVTHVVGIDNAVFGAAYALDNNNLGDDMTLITPTTNVRTLTSLGADLSGLDIIGVATPDPEVLADEGLHGLPDCIAIMEEDLGEEVILFPDEDELTVLPTAAAACAGFDFLTAALEAIGPNPSQEDFLALTAGGFSFEMTGAETADVAEGKVYANSDPGRVYDWDGTTFTLRG
jgi:hypothetical protein